ncbi:hypothetical protein FQZ97_1037630 [compost metagenome]
MRISASFAGADMEGGVTLKTCRDGPRIGTMIPVRARLARVMPRLTCRSRVGECARRGGPFHPLILKSHRPCLPRSTRTRQASHGHCMPFDRRRSAGIPSPLRGFSPMDSCAHQLEIRHESPDCPDVSRPARRYRREDRVLAGRTGCTLLRVEGCRRRGDACLREGRAAPARPEEQ